MTKNDIERIITRYLQQVQTAVCVPARKVTTPGQWCKALDLRRQWFASKVMSGCPNTTTGNTIEPLIDGEEMMARLLTDLKTATSYVFLTGLGCSPDCRLSRDSDIQDSASELKHSSSLKSVIDYLTARAVEVRLLVFGIAKVYSPVGGAFKDDKHLRFRLYGGAVTNGCLHQNKTLIDGKIAYCGGIDIVHDKYGDRWDSPRHLSKDSKRWPVNSKDVLRRSWHDVHTRIAGPAVEDIQENFLRQWQMATNEPTRDSMFQRSGTLNNVKLHPAKRTGNKARSSGAPEAQVVRTIPTTPPPITLGSGLPVYAAPDHAEYSMVETWARAIVNAQHYIYIENQYFSCGLLIQLMVSRLMANKGLHLILLLPQKFEEAMESDSAWGKTVIEKRATKTIGPALAVDWLRTVASGRVVVAYPVGSAGQEVYVHSKVLVVDDKYALIGSANISERSMFVADHELGIAWLDANTGNVRAFRKRLWAEHLRLQTTDARLEARDAPSLVRLWGPATPEGVAPTNTSSRIRRWNQLKVDSTKNKRWQVWVSNLAKGRKCIPMHEVKDVDVGSMQVKCISGKIRVELFTNQYYGDEKCEGGAKDIAAGESWSFVFPTRGVGDQDNKALVTGLAESSLYKLEMVGYNK